MVKMENDKSVGTFKIHNVGFYNLAPRQIKCISYNESKVKLAVSRDDASIEIWDMRHALHMEKCILGEPSASVEGLGWLRDRLFSTGQTGELTEWNLQRLEAERKVTLTGNTAWCMDIDESNGCIAVGTDEGFMNIFSVDNDDLNFVKLFDKQDGRILCCKYDSTGKFIVTGSTGTVRIWNVANGHAIYRMKTSQCETKRETNVWSLAVLTDLTIIAGDSRGWITVWDGKNGNQIESFHALEADVLTVAVNSDETVFCCSGVDPKIKIFVPNPKTRGWIPNLKRNVHDHDVKALTFVNEKIISGGTDGFINVSYSVKNSENVPGAKPGDRMSKLRRCQYGPFLPQPCAAVAPLPRLLLLKYFNYLELWKLGRPNDNVQLAEDEVQKNFLSLDENLEKLVELRTQNRQPITCASISPDGRFLFYSTKTMVRLFQLDRETEKPALTKVKVDSEKFIPCAKVLFSSDSKSMFCVNNSGDINIFALTYNDEVDIKKTISTKKVINETISIVCLSKCGKYLVCAGACGTVGVWMNNNNRWKYHTNLPKRDSPPTAIEIHSNSCRIVLAFSDYKIFEFDLTEGRITCSTESGFVKKLPHFKNMAIKNIILDEHNEDVVILQNDSFLFVLEKDKVMKSKKSKVGKNSETLSNNGFVYKLKKDTGNYEHFVYLSWLSPSEIVAISVNPVTLIEQLPPSMKQKKFGIS